MSWSSVRPAFALRLALFVGALAFLAGAIFMVHESATAPRLGVSRSSEIIICNVICAALLMGALAYSSSGTRATPFRVIAWLLGFLLLVAAQLLLDTQLYFLFGGRLTT